MTPVKQVGSKSRVPDLPKVPTGPGDPLDGMVGGGRYPDYHSLNLRFDRRFYFQGSNLVWYVSVWNAYNRKNIASYSWNGVKGQVDTMYQWGLLPIFGLEWEF